MALLNRSIALLLIQQQIATTSIKLISERNKQKGFTYVLCIYSFFCAACLIPKNYTISLIFLFFLFSFYLGVYAFRLPDENGENGIWVGYEDADSVGNKAGYVRAKGLGGIAVVDVTLDDFRGLCTGEKYPLLRAAKFRL